MNSKHLAALALAVAGLTSAGLAQARGNVDLQWSVTIGSQGGGPVGIYAPQPYAYRAPVVVAAPVYRPYPVYPVHQGYPVHQPYRHAGWGDADRDGVPNRYDRVYNPRWDRDGDGVPNRHDRLYNPRWDRDGDGVPNRYDSRDHRQPQHGGGHDRNPRRDDDRKGR